MPITPYLQGQAFDPEAVKTMGIALENACRAVGTVNSRRRVIIAQTVIAVAQRGIKDVDQLTAATLKEIGMNVVRLKSRPVA